MSYIELDGVTKEFKIKTRKKGFAGAVKGFFAPEYSIKAAVDHISLNIEKGELVGYIGPNGAGKSTTLKMLTGILVPTSGTVRVGGIEPYGERKKNSVRMGAVFGQRSQLLWDLPVSDALDLYKKMYRIEEETYRSNLRLFTDILDMGSFIDQPARQLSLGQRMRANLALALIHNPDVVYLDEPTIGLDVLAKDHIRSFIREINLRRKTTVMLTTHDMTDIESVCERIVLIDRGKILYDGSIDAFKNHYSEGYSIKIIFAKAEDEIQDPRFALVEKKDSTAVYRLKQEELMPGEALAFLARNYSMQDISIIETPIEEIVKSIYTRA